MAAQIDHFDLAVADHNVAPGMVVGLHSISYGILSDDEYGRRR